MELNINEIVKDFVDMEFFNCRSEKFNEMRKEMKFCDVTLKINNTDLFKVHKNIIASSCPYFTGLFNGDWKETREDVISLDHEISAECFEIILEYIYTRKLSISKISYEHALSIHEAAGFYNLLKLKQIMSDILLKMVTCDTLLNLWHHGEKFLDANLREKCIEIILKKPVKFFQKNLLQLTFHEMEILCNMRNYNCSTEELYENLILWIKVDFESREKYLQDLLNFIDFAKISGEFMQSKVITDKILYKSEVFVDKIIKELSSSFRVTSKKENIFLISETGIFKIDLEKKICLRLLKHDIKPYFAITKYGLHNILISGGRGSNSCESYCASQNVITEFPSMIEKRILHSVSVFGNKIYAFGGCSNLKMEIFNLETGKWTYGPQMPRKRLFFALENYDNVFHLFGGSSAIYSERFVDTFDITKNEWHTKEMEYGALYYNYRSVSFNTIAYLFGYNDFVKYDFVCNGITEHQYLTKDEFRVLDVLKLDNKILIFGVKSEDFYSAIYDTKTEKLEEIDIDFSQCGDIGSYCRLTTAFA